MQIKVECDKFGHTSGIKNTVVYGGAPRKSQLMDLQNGVEIVIATPGMSNLCMHRDTALTTARLLVGDMPV
jgi:ATP-dependent RNA helicase DDX5/DBP2